jgi:hypothetical protein
LAWFAFLSAGCAGGTLFRRTTEKVVAGDNQDG